MTSKTRKNSILLSLFALVGLGGIGHFYLGKFKAGLAFLLGGLLLEGIPLLVTFGNAWDGVDFETHSKYLDSTFGYGLVIYFCLSLIHLIFISRKTK